MVHIAAAPTELGGDSGASRDWGRGLAAGMSGPESWVGRRSWQANFKIKIEKKNRNWADFPEVLGRNQELKYMGCKISF
jgi:hypothetical protein